MNTWVIIVAAGKGERAGGGIPKQYRPIGGAPVLRRTVKAFLDHPGIDGVQVVYNPEHKALYGKAAGDLAMPAPVRGGASRQESVFLGLQALADKEPDIILIHDAARAFVSQDVITRVVDRVKKTGHGAIPALPVADTLKRAKDGVVETTIDRSNMFSAQTPQGFPFSGILAAHQKAAGKDLTDDAAVAEAAGLAVDMVPGDKRNIKITFEEDFMTGHADVRTGTGFDVHAFEPGDRVILCGVEIPHSAKLKGHSDADAGLHALTDAILGAIGEGDIGDHFPPSDAKWKGAPSDIFLKHAADLVAAKGGRITSADVTLICEAPKIGPHRDKMRARVAGILGIEKERVSVKATTTEKLGFTGRGEGIGAQATATVVFS